MSAHVTMMTTAANAEQAGDIARALVRERLAACVQATAVTSTYVWEGEERSDGEVLLLIKTRAALQQRVAARIAALHSYETPEIVAVPITFGAGAYLSWIDAQTKEEAP